MLNKKIKKKIFKKKIIKKKFFFIEKYNIFILIKKEFIIKIKNIFYKNCIYINNKKNKIEKINILFFKIIKNIYILKNIFNFRKKYFIKNNFYKFSKIIINFIFHINFNFFYFLFNFKISKKNFKRFNKYLCNNNETSKIFFFSYYSYLNCFFLIKKIKKKILTKNICFNLIINYNNLLITKLF